MNDQFITCGIWRFTSFNFSWDTFISATVVNQSIPNRWENSRFTRTDQIYFTNFPLDRLLESLVKFVSDLFKSEVHFGLHPFIRESL